MKRSKVILAGVMGTALEYYDTMLYMHFLPILTPLFFPSEDAFISSLLSMASFAVGFLMRPLGGIVFGHIGDRLGRRVALGISIMLISLPTFVMGLLPTYGQVGIIAPMALILCRLLQNFCVGGEVIGGSIFLVEQAKPGYESRTSSLLNVAIQIGSFIGAGLGLISLWAFLPEWGWRIPFLFGAVFGLFGYYVRTKIQETPEFSHLRQEKRLAKLPLWEALKRDKKSLFRTMGICAGVMTPFQIIYVFMGDVLKTKFQLLPDQILAHNMKLMVLMALVLSGMGYLADKFGYKRIMGLSLLGAICFSHPAFWMMERALTPNEILLMQAVLAVLACGVAAPCCVLVSSLFPVRERYSGYALGWSLGAILFAGLTPLLSLLLVQWTGDSKAPSYILMVYGGAGLASIMENLFVLTPFIGRGRLWHKKMSYAKSPSKNFLNKWVDLWFTVPKAKHRRCLQCGPRKTDLSIIEII